MLHAQLVDSSAKFMDRCSFTLATMPSCAQRDADVQAIMGSPFMAIVTGGEPDAAAGIAATEPCPASVDLGVDLLTACVALQLQAGPWVSVHGLLPAILCPCGASQCPGGAAGGLCLVRHIQPAADAIVRFVCRMLGATQWARCCQAGTTA